MSLNDVHISRRAFLQELAAATILASAPRVAFAEPQPPHTRQLLMGTRKTSIGAYGLIDHNLRETDVGFLVHSIPQNPTNPRQIIAMEKWGYGMAALDLDEMRITRQIPAEENTMYYGHGFFTKDGKTFFTTRVDTNTGLGHLVGFDAQTFKLVADYQVTPGGLHECHWVDERTAMVTSIGLRSNYGVHPQDGEQVEASGLVHVDMQSGKVLDKKLVDDPRQLIAHFRKSSTGALIALSSAHARGNTEPGKIYFAKDMQSALQEVKLPENNRHGEMLSVAFSQDGATAAVTNPVGSLIILLNGKEGRVEKILHKQTYGVSYDNSLKEFIFSSTNKIAAITANNKKWNRLPLAPEMNTDAMPLMAKAHNLIV
jgi:hypothetical protein